MNQNHSANDHLALSGRNLDSPPKNFVVGRNDQKEVAESPRERFPVDGGVVHQQRASGVAKKMVNLKIERDLLRDTHTEFFFRKTFQKNVFLIC